MSVFLKDQEHGYAKRKSFVPGGDDWETDPDAMNTGGHEAHHGVSKKDVRVPKTSSFASEKKWNQKGHQGNTQAPTKETRKFANKSGGAGKSGSRPNNNNNGGARSGPSKSTGKPSGGKPGWSQGDDLIAKKRAAQAKRNGGAAPPVHKGPGLGKPPSSSQKSGGGAGKSAPRKDSNRPAGTKPTGGNRGRGKSGAGKGSAAGSSAAAPAPSSGGYQPSCDDGRTWMIQGQNGNQAIIVNVEDPAQGVYVIQCSDSVVQVKGKCSSVTLDNCNKCGVVFEDVIGTVDVIRSKGCQVQCTGVAPTIAVDSSESIKVFLSEGGRDAEIITSRVSEINIVVIGEEAEHSVPAQFRSKLEGNELVTTPVTHQGV